jgi:hypothetical protein
VRTIFPRIRDRSQNGATAVQIALSSERNSDRVELQPPPSLSGASRLGCFGEGPRAPPAQARPSPSSSRARDQDPFRRLQPRQQSAFRPTAAYWSPAAPTRNACCGTWGCPIASQSRAALPGRQLTDKEVTGIIGDVQARPCSDRPYVVGDRPCFIDQCTSGFVRIDAFCIDLAVVLARRLRCHIARCRNRLRRALDPGAVFALQQILRRRDQCRQVARTVREQLLDA